MLTWIADHPRLCGFFVSWAFLAIVGMAFMIGAAKAKGDDHEN